MSNPSALSPQAPPVVMIAFYYLPANTSGVQRAVRFAKYLTRAGHDVHVVCRNADLAGSAVPGVTYAPNTSTRKGPAGWLEKLANVLQRLLPYNEQLPWTPHAIAVARQLLAHQNEAVLISTSPPLATHLAALWLKLRYGVKCIFDFRDPIAGNPNRSRSWARPYDRLIQWLCFRSADIILTVTDVIAEDWKRIYPQWAPKIHVLWNAFDPEDAISACPLPERSFRLLSHVGVLYSGRHPINILRAVYRLTNVGRLDPNQIRIRLTGPIDLEDEFRRNAVVCSLVERGALEICSALVPRSTALREIATSDYLLLLDINNLSQVGYAVPAKLFDYVLIGRPLLAVTDRNSPVANILTRCGLHHRCIYHDDSDEEIDRKVLELFALPTEPRPPSQWFLDHFNGARQVEKLSRLIHSLRGPTDTRQ